MEVEVDYPLTSIEFVDDQVRIPGHNLDGYGFFHYKILPKHMNTNFFTGITENNWPVADHGTGYMISRYGFNFCYTNYTEFPNHTANSNLGGQNGLPPSFSNTGKLLLGLIQPGQNHPTPEESLYYRDGQPDGIRENCWAPTRTDERPPRSTEWWGPWQP